MAVYKLSEICTKIGSGATPRGGKESYSEKGISLIRSQNVLDYKFSYDGLAHITEEQAEKLNNVEVRSNDVLLNITGDSVARACKVVSSVLPARVNQHVAIVRANEDVALSSYILYYLQLSKKNLLLLASGGATRNALTKEMIENLQISIPSIERQEKIVAIIDNLQDKIELNNRINENLQQQSFALFEQLLSQSEGDLCKLSEIAELNPKRQLAKGVVARCIDMAQLSTSGTFPNGWEMKPYNGGMRFSNGDTIIARITPCLENGKTAFIDFLDNSEVAFGSTEYIILSSKGVYPAEFFYCLARYPAFVDYAVKNMNGSSGRQRVSADTLGKYLLPRISEEEICLFRDTMTPMFKAMRNNSLENMRLSVIRDTLLPKLMSGELDVSDIDL